MDNSLGRQFFLNPQTPMQRRYETIRAVVVEGQPLTEVAHRYGYAYGTIRNLLTQFHRQCRAEQLPPFLPRRHGDDQRAPSTARAQRGRPSPPLPIASNCLSVVHAPCVHAWPVSFCSGRCWLNLALTALSSKPVIRARP